MHWLPGSLLGCLGNYDISRRPREFAMLPNPKRYTWETIFPVTVKTNLSPKLITLSWYPSVFTAQFFFFFFWVLTNIVNNFLHSPVQDLHYSVRDSTIGK